MRLRRAAQILTSLGVLLLLGACQPNERAASSATLEAEASASLDSCEHAYRSSARSRTGSFDSNESRGSKGNVEDFPAFSLFIPNSARIVATDRAPEHLSLSWPECPGCRFSIAIQPDSGLGLEMRIARLVAEQRRIDSVNRDPDAIHEFDEIDGPPVLIATPGARGYQIDRDCGDCAATELLFERAGRIATVAFGGDDDVPELGRHLCVMTVVGKTFAWRR